MKIDLHTHSTASDGQYTPTALVELAQAAGVEVLALTDHDALTGIPEAQDAGNRLGIIIIPGIELSATEYPNLHILGYCLDISNPMLLRLCEEARLERERHSAYIGTYLASCGVSIDLEEVRILANGGAIGRPHFAQVLVRHGYVKTIREAFDRYLDTEDYRRIARKKPTVRRCIETIRIAGGIPVLAHPYQLYLEADSLEEELQTLISYGLAGIECFYPKHTPQQQTLYLRLAKKFGLHVTAGSDFHGERIHLEDRIIPVETDIDWLLN